MARPGRDRVVDPAVRVLRALAGKDADGRPAGLLRAARRGLHDLAEAAADDDAATLGEQSAHLLRLRRPLGAAADNGDLHGADDMTAAVRLASLGVGRSCSGAASRAAMSPGCSAPPGRRSLAPRTSCSTRRCSPRRRRARSSRATPSSRCASCARTPTSSSGARRRIDEEARRVQVVSAEHELELEVDVRAARRHPRRRSRAPSRSPASRSTRSASSRSPTRSTSATTSCASSRPPPPTRENAERHLTFVFVGAGYAGVEALGELSDLVRDALRYYPELEGPAAALGAGRRRARRSSRRSRGASASTPPASWRRRGVDIRVSTTLGLPRRRERHPLRRDALRDAHARLDGRREGPPDPLASSACRWTSAAG